MSDEEPALALLNGDQPSENLLSDASDLNDLPEDDFQALIEAVFEEFDPEELLNEGEEITTQVEEKTSLQGSDIESVLDFLRAVILEASRQNLIEAQVQEDLKALSIQTERADVLAAEIDSCIDSIRQHLLSRSIIEPLPNLVNTSWNVEKVVSTEAVQATRARRVLFELTLEDGGDQETVSFQATDEALRQLFSSLGQLQDELSEGVQDLE